MCFHEDTFVGCHFREVKNTSCFHVHRVPCFTVLPVPDMLFSFTIPDYLFRVLYIAIPAFRVYRNPLCSHFKNCALRCKYCFVMYHLEERRVSTAIQYKKCAQIFVSSVNKNPIRYAICDATNSYTV